nr:hypothetical protein [Pseudomonas toyotomiensis]
MYRLFKLGAAVVAVSLLSGCGEEDFTGAYRYTLPGEALVLNIEGGEAKVFAEKEGRVLLRSTLTASVKDEKLFLDTADDAKRVVMKRNVDERSLDCLNCKVLSFGKDEVHWKYDPHGVYDVDQLLKEQARKDEEVAARLSTYEGTQEHVVQMCMEEELPRDICECVPKELKKMGVSDADFIKFSNPNFSPRVVADAAQQKKYAGNVKKAAMRCIAVRG